MSKEKLALGIVAVAEVPEFILGVVRGSYKKFAKLEEIPAGTPLFCSEDMEDMDKEELEKVYAHIVGVDPKKFPTKAMAIQSLIHQVEKMPTVKFVEESAEPPADDEPKATVKKVVGRKLAETYELLDFPPEKQAEIGKLAPQARECVKLMALLAAKLGKTRFSEAELKPFMNGNKEPFSSVQEPWRIFQYYRSKLEGVGVLAVS
jgi:hypothetical protein